MSSTDEVGARVVITEDGVAKRRWTSTAPHDDLTPSPDRRAEFPDRPVRAGWTGTVKGRVTAALIAIQLDGEDAELYVMQGLLRLLPPETPKP